jgi:CTP:molybdopterin cytidylyltransferase MocA
VALHHVRSIIRAASGEGQRSPPRALACFNRAVRIAAVVLAGGAGRRMGGPKALLRIGGETFAARVARTLLRPGVAEVIAVLGHGAESVRKEAGLGGGVRIAVNPRPEDGMLSSLLTGLDAAEGAGAQAILVHPVDHPLVAPETVDAVVEALLGGAIVAVPSHEGRRGHPTGFAREAFPALRAADPSRGARSVLQAHPEWVTHVKGDPRCRAGVDWPEDYARLVSG